MRTTSKRGRVGALALTALLAMSVIGTQTRDAEAYSGRRVGTGFAAGIIAGSILGAYAYGGRRYDAPRAYGYSGYASAPTCYAGPRQCDWAGRRCWVSHWGERVCTGGEWRCWRPSVCD